MILLVWLLFGIAAAIVASNKGRSGFGWFLLGSLLGPFGLLFAFIVSKVEITPPLVPLKALSVEQILANQTKTCPHCAETIKLAAQKCRFCGESFDSDQVVREINSRQADIQAHQAAGHIQCPNCGNWDVLPYAVWPDGGHGPWCRHCKKAVMT